MRGRMGDWGDETVSVHYVGGDLLDMYLHGARTQLGICLPPWPISSDFTS